MMLVLLTAVSCGDLVFPDAEEREALYSIKKTPVKEISLEGQVTDGEGAPLPDIRVILIGQIPANAQRNNGPEAQPIDTLFTNTSGKYVLERRFVASALTDVTIYADDPAGNYTSGSVSVQNVNIGAVAPTINLYKSPN